MSTLSIKHDPELGKIIIVNGKKHYAALDRVLGRIDCVERASYCGQKLNSEFVVTSTTGDMFHVFGGKHSGGGRHEWYVKGSIGTLHCFSLVECLRAIASI